jgi:hypothetical protein
VALWLFSKLIIYNAEARCLSHGMTIRQSHPSLLLLSNKYVLLLAGHSELSFRRETLRLSFLENNPKSFDTCYNKDEP